MTEDATKLANHYDALKAAYRYWEECKQATSLARSKECQALNEYNQTLKDYEDLLKELSFGEAR